MKSTPAKKKPIKKPVKKPTKKPAKGKKIAGVGGKGKGRKPPYA
jgi:hypothetical protein